MFFTSNICLFSKIASFRVIKESFFEFFVDWVNKELDIGYVTSQKKNLIKIRNISSVEKDVRGLIPSNVSEKVKYIKKVSESFRGQINTLKHLILNHHSKHYQVKKRLFRFLSILD